jgi:hypothetical protein
MYYLYIAQQNQPVYLVTGCTVQMFIDFVSLHPILRVLYILASHLNIPIHRFLRKNIIQTIHNFSMVYISLSLCCFVVFLLIFLSISCHEVSHTMYVPIFNALTQRMFFMKKLTVVA